MKKNAIYVNREITFTERGESVVGRRLNHIVDDSNLTRGHIHIKSFETIKSHLGIVYYRYSKLFR